MTSTFWQSVSSGAASLQLSEVCSGELGPDVYSHVAVMSESAESDSLRVCVKRGLRMSPAAIQWVQVVYNRAVASFAHMMFKTSWWYRLA